MGAPPVASGRGASAGKSARLTDSAGGSLAPGNESTEKRGDGVGVSPPAFSPPASPTSTEPGGNTTPPRNTSTAWPLFTNSATEAHAGRAEASAAA